MEGRPRQFTDDFRKAAVIAFRTVNTRTDSRATHSQVTEKIDATAKHFLIAFNHAGPAAEFLSQGQGSRILQVGAADLHDVFKGFLLITQGLIEGIHSRKQLLFDEQNPDHVKARREGIIRTL